MDMASTARATLSQAHAKTLALRHRLRDSVREGRLMTATVITFMALYMGAAYLLMERGLSFVHRLPLVGPLLTERMLYLLFFFFFLMLIISNAAICGISIFRRGETGWQLSLPIPHSSVVLWKTIESLLLSSWGLILLSAPILAAFGRAFDAGPGFYFMCLPAVVALIAIASNVSTWLLLFVVRCYRPWWLKAAVIMGLLLCTVIAWRINDDTGAKMMSGDVATNVNYLLRNTKICTHPFLPSSWVAEVVISSGKGIYDHAWFFNLTLLSHALVVWLVTHWLAQRFFYGTWNHAIARTEEQQRNGNGGRGFLRARKSQWWLPGLSRHTRALVTKDARTFLREPMQWGQCALIFGLLLFYTANLRHIETGYGEGIWNTVTSYLNITVCCLAMSTLTTRFVFPQFSLEGQRLWILGLAPFPLTLVLRQKLLLNLAAALPITTLLVVISSLSLKLPMHRGSFFVTAIIMQTIGLNTLALALGAVMPNLKETNSAKIVSGFGGTLCLVLSFFYIASSIGMLTVPAVKVQFAQDTLSTAKLNELERQMEGWSLAGVFILTVVAAGLSYLFALKRIKTLALS
jgi:ABC-2 type transport system permease protein